MSTTKIGRRQKNVGVVEFGRRSFFIEVFCRNFLARWRRPSWAAATSAASAAAVVAASAAAAVFSIGNDLAARDS